MTTFETIAAQPWHCGAIMRRLRTTHIMALSNLGQDVHRELRQAFDQSAFRLAWKIDGRLAALGGITGSILETYGYAWLAITNEATEHPIALLREIKVQLTSVMRRKHELATTVIGTDDAAKRLAIFLGFHIADEGPGSPAYSKMGRRLLADHIEKTPEVRIPIGTGYVIGMGYHEEAGG